MRSDVALMASLLTSPNKNLPSLGNVIEQLRSGVQVPESRFQRTVSHISRECQYMLADAFTVDGTVLKSSHSKRMTERMDTRLRQVWLPLDSRRTGKRMEDLADRLVAQSVSTKRYEQIVLLSGNQAAACDVPVERCRCRVMDWNQSVLTELRPADEKAVCCNVVHPKVE